MSGIEPETSRFRMLINKQEGTDIFIKFLLTRKLNMLIGHYYSHEIVIFFKFQLSQIRSDSARVKRYSQKDRILLYLGHPFCLHVKYLRLLKLLKTKMKKTCLKPAYQRYVKEFFVVLEVLC